MANSIPNPYAPLGGSGYPAAPVVSGAAAAGEFLAATSPAAAAWRDLTAADIPGTLNATTFSDTLTASVPVNQALKIVTNGTTALSVFQGAIVDTSVNTLDDGHGNMNITGGFNVSNPATPGLAQIAGITDGDQFANLRLAQEVNNNHQWNFSYRSNENFLFYHYDGATFVNAFVLSPAGVVSTLHNTLDDGSGNATFTGTATARNSVNVVNAVNAYGADPAGVNDSTTAINNALSAVNSAGGGAVYLPAGLYLISQSLLLHSNTMLLGAGMGATTIRVKSSTLSSFAQVGSNPGAVMICTSGNSSASRIRIADLTLDMNEANNTTVPVFANAAESAPIGIQNVTGLTIERVEVINAVGYSIFPWGCSDVKIRGCRVVTGQTSAGYNQQDGIHVTDSTAVLIQGNTITTGTNGGDDAIAVQGVSTGCASIAITGNVILASGTHGITLVLGGATVTGVSISGNTVLNTQNEGLLFFYTTFSAAGGYLITDVTVAGNTFQSVALSGTGAGITLQDAFGGTGSHVGTAGYAAVTIAGNVFDGMTATGGIGIYAQQGSDLAINDNVFRNWGATRGICIGDNDGAGNSRPVANAEVSGNTVDMTATAATAPTGIIVIDSVNAIVTDNAIIGPGTGVANGVGITMLGINTAPAGCVVNDNDISAWQFGIFETNSGAQPDHNTYWGNTAYLCTTPLTISGTHELIGDPSAGVTVPAGGLTVTAGGATVTAGGVAIGAGTTSVAPLKLTSGTNLTTAAAGAVEYDGTAFYATSAASSRQVVNAEQIQVLSGTRTFTNNTSAQAIFNATTNGTLTVQGSTTYEFECLLDVTGLSSSSHSINFGFGGGASFTSIMYSAITATAGGGAAAFGINTSASATAITAAGTGTVLLATLRGCMRINAAGTIIPQLTQVTASAAAVVQANSFFRCWPIGSNTVTNVGDWT